MMDTDFSPASSDAGSALQAAWFGGMPVGHQSMASSRQHLTTAGCMALVRRALYAAGRPMRLCEIRAATGRGGMEIGSVLIKLQRRSDVAKATTTDGGKQGASYVWVSESEPGARNAAGAGRRPAARVIPPT